MTATDAQVRIIMRERSKGKTQIQAAVKANLSSRKTVRKYERLGKMPSEIKKPREYRTRQDPFETHWLEVAGMLKNAPELEAKALFEWLCEQHPEAFQEGQLRTFQRRVSAWRGLNGSQILTLEQVRIPGEILQTDGTWMTELGITIRGQAFPHLLIHCVLPYSNWEWGRIAQSESLLAIRSAVQSTLLQLGHVPKIHQTDNTTAATHQLGTEDQMATGEDRGFNLEYAQWMAHLGMKPQTIHRGTPDENGDVEASNKSFKRAFDQHLLLRGSRDFNDQRAVEEFAWFVMGKRNVFRRERLAEELAVMSPLQAKLWPEVRELRPRVNRNGIVRIQHNGYSVPSGLVGKRVTARVSEWEIEIWYANQCVEVFPRLTGAQKYRVNYRHVIDSLLCKPGGFRQYRHREDLFPTRVFRQAWETLDAHFSPRRADLAYLRILKLAAKGLESDVAAVLEELLAGKQRWDDQTVTQRLQPYQGSIPDLPEDPVDLKRYDQLLSMVVSGD